ncbi:hypothetical protein B0H11DRAFT_2043604, partial [Mycena galericulata]
TSGMYTAACAVCCAVGALAQNTVKRNSTEVSRRDRPLPTYLPTRRGSTMVGSSHNVRDPCQSPALAGSHSISTSAILCQTRFSTFQVPVHRAYLEICRR